MPERSAGAVSVPASKGAVGSEPGAGPDGVGPGAVVPGVFGGVVVESVGSGIWARAPNAPTALPAVSTAVDSRRSRTRLCVRNTKDFRLRPSQSCQQAGQETANWGT